MSEEKIQELLGEFKETLAKIPEDKQKPVAQALVHDLGVTARAIRIMEGETV